MTSPTEVLASHLSWKGFRNHVRVHQGTNRPDDFFSCMKKPGTPGTEDHDHTGSAPTPPELPSQHQDAEGDFGGRFGYGHPAHRPDPFATYTFSAGAVRPLPVDSKKRWR
ncbi:hypothetical protein [Mesorhizobium sangaii]|uniref:Uncharacterized protein n=1 Tax=Mesorhizobium sangaii TaxID=505389 RepID=A0A841PFT8_9HYPH|nr:hypothetical protein [Mesorhizobium sangaii]MBB6411538.1 hypothetical protein [Mesorhizobium sangaii]